MTLAYIALGGSIGSVLRYLMVTQATGWFGNNFPYGTVIVNILGSLCMGIVCGYLAAKNIPADHNIRTFVAIGILGGFTTFSAFSMDTVLLMTRGELGSAFLYVTASVVLSIGAFFIGTMLTRCVV